MRPNPPGRHRAGSTRILIALVVLAAAAVAALVVGLVLAQQPAHANGHTSGGVVPGAACTTPGVVAARGVERYQCVQRPGEDCPHWHWIYNPDTPKSTRTAWPVAPCRTCTPPPAVPSSPPAGSTPPPAVVPVDLPPPAAADKLPVTGGDVGVTALVGVLFTAAGVGLRFWPRRC